MTVEKLAKSNLRSKSSLPTHGQIGLKLKPSKSHLLKDEVLVLGHVVDGQGISPILSTLPGHLRLEPSHEPTTDSSIT